jgi:hypothetical protein
MGGLFQAQNQQLQQTMPQYTAPVDAAAIGSGNFGSLRGQTAYNKAMADAQANLFAQQNQAALQNQSTGVQAGIGAGTVSQENINNLLQTGQYQQAAPFINASNYGKILGGIQAPTTVKNQTQTHQIMNRAHLFNKIKIIHWNCFKLIVPGKYTNPSIQPSITGIGSLVEIS